MENARRIVGDGARVVARALVYAVVGGGALITVGTVGSVLGPMLALDLATPAMAAWWTVFTAVVVQGIPFLLLGTAVSAAIGAFVPERLFRRVLPGNPALAVPVAGAAGVVLPGCECASVPVAHSLMRRGVAPAAALAFLLSAPAVNPVVLVATSIAFPGDPAMVGARLVASLATAVAMGWLWVRFGPGAGRRDGEEGHGTLGPVREAVTPGRGPAEPTAAPRPWVPAASRACPRGSRPGATARPPPARRARRA